MRAIYTYTLRFMDMNGPPESFHDPSSNKWQAFNVTLIQPRIFECPDAFNFKSLPASDNHTEQLFCLTLMYALWIF